NSRRCDRALSQEGLQRAVRAFAKALSQGLGVARFPADGNARPGVLRFRLCRSQARDCEASAKHHAQRQSLRADSPRRPLGYARRPREVGEPGSLQIGGGTMSSIIDLRTYVGASSGRLLVMVDLQEKNYDALTKDNASGLSRSLDNSLSAIWHARNF